MKMVAFEIIIDVVFGIVIVVAVVVNCESPTLNPAFKIIIVGVIDEAIGPINLRRIGVVVFEIVIAVVVVIIVNGRGPTFSGLILHPSVRIIIVCVDEAKGPIIGVRGLDTAIGTIIV